MGRRPTRGVQRRSTFVSASGFEENIEDLLRSWEQEDGTKVWKDGLEEGKEISGKGKELDRCWQGLRDGGCRYDDASEDDFVSWSEGDSECMTEGYEDEDDEANGTWVNGNAELPADGLPLTEIRTNRVLKRMTREQLLEREVRGMPKTGFSADNPAMPAQQALFLNYCPTGVPKIRKEDIINRNDLEKLDSIVQALRSQGNRKAASKAKDCAICRVLNTKAEEQDRECANVLETYQDIMKAFDELVDSKPIDDVLRAIKKLHRKRVMPLSQEGIHIEPLRKSQLRRHFWYKGGCGYRSDRKLRWKIFSLESITEEMECRVIAANPVTGRTVVDYKAIDALKNLHTLTTKLYRELEEEKAARGVPVGTMLRTRTLRRKRIQGPGSAASISSGAPMGAAGGGGGGTRNYREEPTVAPRREKPNYEFYSR